MDSIGAYTPRIGKENSMEYYQGEEGWARLDTQIVISHLLDMIQLDSDTIEEYAGKALLANLAPWLEQSIVFSRDDFPENLLNAYTVKGKLAGIPNEFQCYTACLQNNQGRGKFAGDRLSRFSADNSPVDFPGKKIHL